MPEGRDGTAADAIEGVASRALDEERERTIALWITNISHALIHFQGQMIAVLYPLMMAELGFGYAQLGLLSAVRNLVGTGTQMLYGFVVPFIRRPLILAAGNLALAAGSAWSGLAQSYPSLVAARTLTQIGQGPQHPVGSTLLASYFPRRTGAALALHFSAGQVGALVAPLAAGVLLLVFGWRQVFVLVTIAAALVAFAYLLLRDRIGRAPAPSGSPRERLTAGWASYRRALRNRNIIVVSLVMMSGAAGRGEGVNVAYMGPHFVNDLLLSTVLAGVALSLLQAGGIVGPIGFAWLSERLSRRGVIQASLVLSALSTLWVAHVDANPLALLPSMVIYGAVVMSRNPLTQSLIADSLDDADRDAAFGVYYFIGFISAPIWTLFTGVLVEAYGFATAFSVLSVSYLVGSALLLGLDERRLARVAPEPWEDAGENP